VVAAGLGRVVGGAGRVRLKGSVASSARSPYTSQVETWWKRWNFSTPTRRTASHKRWVPTTFVSKNTPGFVIAYELCDSAAKLTIVSIS
jgi:hypothetical protein